MWFGEHTSKALFFALAVAATWSAGAADCRVTVDFTKPAGRIKNLHGVNNAPCRLQKGAKVWEFEEAGIPLMRTHDSVGAWGGTHYVDIPNVFPDFEADENDPKSYDFAFTDAYLSSVVAAGTKIYYRLGVTIENNWRIKAYNIFPPKDCAKWARICEHVVRHYNEGWADGFRWNVEYWEIWNEPENPPMWQGSKAQYFELYRVAANHLKTCFPNIKVGGYGSCGFYAVDDREAAADPFRKSFVTWFEDFLRYVTAPETKAPLDFYSWHVYLADTPDRIAAHARYVRRMLDGAGLAATESHLNEWNYPGLGWNEFAAMRTAVGAARVMSALCLMQREPVDLAMYYDACPTRSYCGLFHLVGSDLRTPTIHALRLWNWLYRLDGAVESASDAPRLGVAAAGNGAARAILLVNNGDTPQTVTLDLKGADSAAFETWLVDDAHKGLAPERQSFGKSFTLEPRQIALLATPDLPVKAIDRGVERKVFAGQNRPEPDAFGERMTLIVNEPAEHFFVASAKSLVRETEGKPNAFTSLWDFRFPPDITCTEQGVERYVDALAGGKLTHLFINVNYQRSFYPSRVIEPIWTSLDEPGRQKQPFIRDMRDAFARGFDAYAVMVRRCRERGVSPWLSFRMNDIHGTQTKSDPMVGTFWREHPEWHLNKDEGWANGLDYAEKAVRDRMAAYIREAVERYDVDGVELDLIRFPFYFRAGTEGENAPLLTAFVREVRRTCAAAAARRGHPVKIAVRLLPDPKQAAKMGADVGAWVREGLVDLVIPCNMYGSIEYEYHLDDWRKLLGNQVRIVAGTDNGIVENGKRRNLNLGEYRKWIDLMRRNGSDGVYFFNFPLRPYRDETWRGILQSE